MKSNVIESIKSAGFRAAIIVAAMTWFGTSMAAPPLHARTPGIDMNSCEAVNWSTDLTSRFPWIKAGCQEVIEVKGVKYARFNADFVRRNRDGSVVFDFKDRDNKDMGRVTLQPGARQRLVIEGESYRFADLTRGQNLHLYVPENMYAVATEPGEPRDELAEIVTPMEKSEVAQVDTAPAPMVNRLPRTAGPLPLVLLAGLMSLLFGFGMSLRRRVKR